MPGGACAWRPRDSDLLRWTPLSPMGAVAAKLGHMAPLEERGRLWRWPQLSVQPTPALWSPSKEGAGVASL